MNHIEYLTETLIPDLRASGMEATADDFQTCVDMIRELSDALEKIEQDCIAYDGGKPDSHPLAFAHLREARAILTKVKGGQP